MTMDIDYRWFQRARSQTSAERTRRVIGRRVGASRCSEMLSVAPVPAPPDKRMSWLTDITGMASKFLELIGPSTVPLNAIFS